MKFKTLQIMKLTEIKDDKEMYENRLNFYSRSKEEIKTLENHTLYKINHSESIKNLIILAIKSFDIDFYKYDNLDMFEAFKTHNEILVELNNVTPLTGVEVYLKRLVATLENMSSNLSLMIHELCDDIVQFDIPVAFSNISINPQSGVIMDVYIDDNRDYKKYKDLDPVITKNVEKLIPELLQERSNSEYDAYYKSERQLRVGCIYEDDICKFSVIKMELIEYEHFYRMHIMLDRIFKSINNGEAYYYEAIYDRDILDKIIYNQKFDDYRFPIRLNFINKALLTRESRI